MSSDPEVAGSQSGDGSRNLAGSDHLRQHRAQTANDPHGSLSDAAVFDLLMRPAPDLSDTELIQVKNVAEKLLDVLKRDKIVLDWRKQQSTRAAVRVTVEEMLDQLPEKFTRQVYAQKCDTVYHHVFDSYWDVGRSAYAVAA